MLKKTIPLIFCLGLIVAFLTSSCALFTPPFAPIAKPGALEKQSLTPSSTPIQQSMPEFQAFYDDVHALIRNRDFGALESLAKTYRRKKDRFTGGGWKLHSFYGLVSTPVSPVPTDEQWERQFEFLSEWKDKMPESATPRAALAQAYLVYAWQARGAGFAGEVSREGRRLFGERLEKAASELDRFAEIEERCHGYYAARLILGTAKGWNREIYDRAFEEAVAYEPDYQYFYLEKATYLLPRWDGKPGEWENFADGVKDRLGDEREGLKMYYQIVAAASRYHGRDFFGTNRVSWEDTKRGFELFDKEYGMSLEKLNEYGRMAIHANDAQESCKTFRRLGGDNDFDADVWDSRRNFETYRMMALQFCQIPKLENQAK